MVFQTRTYSVLIVSSTEKFSRSLSELLPSTDFWPVTVVKNCGQARRALLDRAFDLVLINTPLTDDFGMRLAVDLCGESASSVLLFVKSELYNDICAKVTEYGVLTAPKPASVQIVSQYLRVMCAARERLRRMEDRQASVEERIEEIRLVNRAKWLLIQNQGMTEAEAHRAIEKQAMDTRKSKRAVAEAILRTWEGSGSVGETTT